MSPPFPFSANPFANPFAPTLCDRLAYYGIASNLVIFLTSVFNFSNSEASTSVMAWSGTCYLTPLIGAFLADAYFGRFKVILSFSCLFYIPGLILLALTAGLPELHPASNEAATSAQLAALYCALYLVALGTGGIKPCVSSFGADQFDSTNPAEAALIPRFFNYFYAAINIGAIIASLFLIYIQEEVSWALGYGIPAGVFVFAVGIFLLGVPRYRFVPPAGSPFSRIFRVLHGAFAHRKAVVPENEKELYEYQGQGNESIIIGQEKLPRTASFKWLEKACTKVEGEPMPEDDDEDIDDVTYLTEGKESLGRLEEKEGAVVSSPAKATVKEINSTKKKKKSVLVTLTEVEELKILTRLLPIAFTLIMYNAIYAQMATMFVIQGTGMNTSLGSLTIPPATVSVLDCLSVLVFVFLYDLVIAPYFERKGKPITHLQRIGWGYFVAIGSMLVAGGLEVVRLQVVADNNLQDTDPTAEGAPVVPISVWWQIPQYMLIGLSEVLAMVGSLAMFYQEAPDGLRSTCSAIQLLATAFGNYVSSALLAIIQAITTSNGSEGWIAPNVNESHLDYWFFTLAVLMAINTLVFFWIAKRYRYRDHAVHTSIDPEALALAPSGRMGVPFSAAIVKGMSKDIQQGMVAIESLRSMNVDAMGSSYSQYRTVSKRRFSHVAGNAASAKNEAAMAV
jgi:peptide/histidine transporter 3/4